ncbi:MAG TPA: VOC family protein [Acidimicrobiales bacterium]|nr:VOC family protein [Acidimicrobiales bacterium]
MTLQLANVSFDCDDALKVATFWSAVLDRPLDADASEDFASIGAGSHGTGGQGWLFTKVPEPKVAKNRCHVDLHADDRDGVQSEVDRLVGLGATVLRDPKEEFGVYWGTLQDPEGNELCLAAP